MAENSNNKSSIVRRRGLLRVSVMILSFLCVLELLSGATIYLGHYVFGTPKRISHFQFHPIWTGQNIGQYAKLWSAIHPVYGWDNSLNISPECGYTTDSHGFIHNGDPSRRIQPEAFTIFLIGGSTVAGAGATCNDQTISAHLERLLVPRYPNVQVINAGVAGYYSAIEFSKLANEILYYNPDIVIDISGTNDFRRVPVRFADRDHQYFISEYHMSLYNTLKGTNSLWWSTKNWLKNFLGLANYTYTWFVIDKGLGFLFGKLSSPSQNNVLENVRIGFQIKSVDKKELSAISEEDFEQEIDEKIYHFLHYINLMESIVYGAGGAYYFVLQPILFAETRKLSENERAALRIARVGFYRKYGTDVLTRATYFWEEVDRRIGKTRIRYYNFRSIFPDSIELYTDFAHYNDKGNGIIAEHLANLLVQDGRITDRMTKQMLKRRTDAN